MMQQVAGGAAGCLHLLPASNSRLRVIGVGRLQVLPDASCPGWQPVMRGGSLVISPNMLIPAATHAVHTADLSLQENGFSGPLPVNGSNRELLVLRAKQNEFQDQLSEEVWMLPRLIAMDFTNNRCGSSLQETGLCSSRTGWQGLGSVMRSQNHLKSGATCTG